MYNNLNTSDRSMPKPDTNAQKTQIIEVLKPDYFPMIPQIEQKWTVDQHEKNPSSRSLAAFAIANLADVTPALAANSIIKGQNDNGLTQFIYMLNHGGKPWVYVLIAHDAIAQNITLKGLTDRLKTK